MSRALLPVETEFDGRIWWYAFDGRLHPVHHHAELEFNLVVKGTATYLINERRYKLQRRDLVWLFPAQDHILLEQSADYQMWIVVVRPRLLQRVCLGEANAPLREADPTGRFSRHLTEQQVEHLRALIEEVFCIEDAPRYNVGLAYTLLTAWGAYLLAEQSGSGFAVHPAVEKAVYLICNDPESTSISELAQQVGFSRSHLSRLFREQTSLSIVDFRNRQRVERFLEIYGYGHGPSMHTASLEAGFGSYAQFHRVFKQWMGCTPKEYRGSQGRGTCKVDFTPA